MTSDEAKAEFAGVLLLSPREYQTLILAGKGLSSRQIAARIGRAEKTIWTYSTRIRHLFGLSSYRQVIALGARYVASGLKRLPLVPEDARYKFEEADCIPISWEGRLAIDSPLNGCGMKRLKYNQVKGIK